MKKAAVTLFLIGMFSVGAHEIQPRLETLVPTEIAKILISEGFVRNSIYRDETAPLSLLPNISLASEADDFWDGDAAPFVSETLYLYKKPCLSVEKKDTDISRISSIIRSLSLLEGIEYFSTSRKKMRTLYKSSYVVNSPENRKPLPDPITGTADGVSLYAVQEDLTFGKYLYRYDYRQTNETTAFFSTNIDALSYSIFKLIKPDNLRISLIIHDLGEYLLIYNLTRVDFLAIPGIQKKINSSFSTRADAVYTWFINEYEKEF